MLGAGFAGLEPYRAYFRVRSGTGDKTVDAVDNRSPLAPRFIENLSKSTRRRPGSGTARGGGGEARRRTSPRGRRGSPGELPPAKGPLRNSRHAPPPPVRGRSRR